MADQTNRKNILESFSLEGKTALVTGGAGMYGQQIVRALAEAGARTWTASRSMEKLEQQSAELREQGLDVRPLQMDQGDEDSVRQACEQLKSECGGGLDILVNNAVLRSVQEGYFSPAADIDKSLHVNGTGLMVVTRAVGEIMADGGSVINIGSIMGLVGPEPLNYRGTDLHGWYPDYFYNKGGMANLTRFLASYYGPRGIRVNCLHPGGLENESQPQAFVENYCERTCLNRLANENDLMGSVVFLASNASSYITGVNLTVDGGYTAK